MVSALGSFDTGIIPRISSIQATADDVYTENLNFLIKELPCDNKHYAILNSKGFGGNNASALVASRLKTLQMLEKKHGKDALKQWQFLNEKVEQSREVFKEEVLKQPPRSRYIFGEHVTEGITDLEFSKQAIFDRTNDKIISINSEVPYKDYF